MKPSLADYTVKRLHLAEAMQQDRFQISLADEVIAVVDWSTAHKFMLGRIDPADLVEK